MDLEWLFSPDANTAVEFVSSGKDILIGVCINGNCLRDKSPEQAIMLFVLWAFSGSVGVGEKDFGSLFLNLSKVSELTAIIHSNCLKDLRKSLAIRIMKGVHEPQYRRAGFAGDTECEAGPGLFLQQGKDHGFSGGPLTNHSIALPVAFFQAERCDFRMIGNASAVTLFVLPHTRFIRFTFQCLGQFGWPDAKTSAPDHVVEGARADHLRRIEQSMQPGVASAGIQRPLVFPHLPNHPADKITALLRFGLPVAVCPVGLIDCFAQIWRVARRPSSGALASRCAAPQFVCHS